MFQTITSKSGLKQCWNIIFETPNLAVFIIKISEPNQKKILIN